MRKLFNRKALPPSKKFNLNGLDGIYNQALNDDEKTLVFELISGQGTFVFMMFFDEDDKSKDKLFLFLKRTSCLLNFKMYANHRCGDFFIYLKTSDVEAIKHELNLQGQGRPFDILMFLSELNNLIPQSIPFSAKLDTFKRVWPAVASDLKGVIHEADKIYFTGLKNLRATNRKPTEKTLRKLYLYVDAEPATIKSFITTLKTQQRTCCWTSEINKQKPFSLI